MTRIAYLGPEGTFTEAALRGMVEAQVVPLADFEWFPTASPSAALEMVRSSEAAFACVPIENSIDGSVLPTLDSLATGTPLQIFAGVCQWATADTLLLRVALACRSCSPFCSVFSARHRWNELRQLP